MEAHPPGRRPFEQLLGQVQLGPVGVPGTGALGAPQAEGDRDPPTAIGAAPEQDHDVQPIDLPFLGKGVGLCAPSM